MLNNPKHVPLNATHIEGFVNACLKKNFDSPADIPSCHREWWEMCTSSHKFVAIAAPRGHAKSTAITMAYTLANVLFRERKFILLVSDTEAQSVFFLGNIKRELETNEDIKKFFGVSGLSKDTETDCIVDFDNGDKARIVAKGSEQKLRGINWDNRRPDLIICDDMENDEIVMNPERREKFRRWFNGALLPCRSRDGIIRYVGTILHLDSMLERLMPKEWDKSNLVSDLKVVSPIKNHWYAAKYKAHTRDFTKVLWPEYKDAEWLKAERANYISQGQADIYSQEYLNQPIDEGNSLFRKSDFLKMSKDDLNRNYNYYLGLDLAVTLKQKADFSAFVIGAVDEEGKLYIVESIKERMDSLTIVDTILDLNKKYDLQFAVVEKGAITNSIMPMLNLRMSETNNYVFLHTLSPTQDKVARAQSIRARMRAGGVKFNKDTDWYEDLELEMMRFPRDAHDDQVDAISYLGLALDKFVEAPTKEAILDEEREEDMRESGLFEVGRSQLTGY